MVALTAAVLLLMPILTARGRIGGDELEVFGLVQHFYASGLSLWDYLQSKPGGWLAHRLYWFFQQHAVISVASFCARLVGLQDTEFLQQYAVSYSQSLLAWAGLLTCGWYAVIRLRMSYTAACMLVALVWFAGYGVCFLIGGYIENSMIFLVACRLFFVHEGKAGASRPQAVAGLVVLDFLLFAAKPYSLLFTTLTLPLALRAEPSKTRFIFIYAVGLIFLIALWVLLIRSATEQSGYPNFPWTFSPTVIFERFFNALFSLSFGLAWTFPAIWFLFAGSAGDTSALKLKLSALAGLQLFFSMLYFWHGGIAGGRYLFPYLLFLLPEIARGYRNLSQRVPSIHLLVVLGSLVTVPVIDYRNTNVSEFFNESVFRGTAGTSRLLMDDMYPMYDLSFHPVVFAWRIVKAKTAEEEKIPAASSVPAMLRTEAIYPMTGLSRIIYLLEVRPPIGENALRILESKGAASLGFWKGLRFFSILLVVLGILHCALKEMRESSRVRETP